MSRHLQLARRAPETNPESSPLEEDELALQSKVREFPRRARIEDEPGAPPEPVPSYEMAVRILCPFCGSADSTAATPCCVQAFEFAQGMAAAEAPDPDAFTTALATAHHPSVIVLDRSASVGAREAWRLRDATRPVAALLASALIGAIASVTMQWRLAERTDELSIGSAPPRVAAPPAKPDVAPATAAATVAAAPAPRVVDPVTSAAAAPAPSSAEDTGGARVASNAPSVSEARPVAGVAASPESAVSPAADEPLAPSMATAPAPAPVQLVSVPRPPDPAKWRSLRRGMSRAAVRALLGYPRWTDHTRNIDFWLYEEDSIFGKGWVAFYDMDGPVSTWREP